MFFKEGSASFLKKRSKKLLLTGGLGRAGATARRSKSFFASFFSKKEALALLAFIATASRPR
jgi:hypothetical protein